MFYFVLTTSSVFHIHQKLLGRYPIENFGPPHPPASLPSPPPAPQQTPSIQDVTTKQWRHRSMGEKISRAVVALETFDKMFEKF